MRAIWSVTVRQLLRGKVSTGFAFLSVLLSSVLLSAVLLGGDSLVYTLNVEYYSEFALVALAAVKLLLCVLLAGTALMIRGGFWLSLERRTRMLGQLASVGATPAQLRASVLLEAALLGVVAIPLGMLFAMLGLRVGFFAMNQTQGIQTITNGQGIRLAVQAGRLAAAALWCALALLLAAWGPARRAARLSPMQAMQPQLQRAPKGKGSRTPADAVRLLAKRSRQRAPGRYRVLSLGLAVSAALIFMAFTFNQALVRNYDVSHAPFSYRVYLWGDENAQYPAELLQQLAGAVPDRPGTVTELVEKFYGVREERMVNTLQIVLEDEDFERWYGQPLTGEQGVVPVVWAKAASDLSPEELGEETLLWSFAGPQMVVAGASDTPLPNGIRQKGAEDDRFTLVLVTSRSAFEASGISFEQGEVRSYAVYWDADDGRAVTKVVAPVLAGCGLTYEIQDYTPTGQTVLLGSGVRILLTVFCGGFAAVVLLTSAANILSTVSSSMLQRRRELSLLLSAGMSRRQLARMLAWECLGYGVRGILWGFPAGVVLAWLLADRMLGIPLSSALSPAALLTPVLCVGAVSALALLVSLRMLRRFSILEGLSQRD